MLVVSRQHSAVSVLCPVLKKVDSCYCSYRFIFPVIQSVSDESFLYGARFLTTFGMTD